MNINTFEKSSHGATPNGNAFTDVDVSSIKSKIEDRKHKYKKYRNTIWILAIIALALAGGTVYSQYKLQALTKEMVTVKQTVAGKDAQIAELSAVKVHKMPESSEELMTDLRKHINLPVGTPEISQVNDAENLRKAQPFFKNAENGDAIVVYPTYVVLYRPSTDIIIAATEIAATKK